MSKKSKIKQLVYSCVNLFKEEKKVPIPMQCNTTNLLKEKIALITGGSGGIGYAIAQAFIKNGCKVIIAGTNECKLIYLCNKLNEISENSAKYIIINILEVDSLVDKLNQAVQLFDENRIDILVNSAGVASHHDFFNTSESDYDRIMSINIKGTFFMCQTMSKYMIEKKIKGHILNISSSSALRPAWTPYEVSKWSIKGFTLGLADTLLPHGIIVNAIAPGPVATPMLNKTEGDSIYSATNPSKRFAMPNEIANLAVFMVSEMGDLIVGDTFYITGGSGTISLHK